jgi:His/Glu/Gln/Arg/opine family amino acid ABC transporter permease subunit
MLMDFDTLVTYLPLLLAGAFRTLQLTLATLLLGILIAVPVALARNDRRRGWRFFGKGFIFFFRGAPLLVIVYLLYYGLPQMPGVKDSIIWHLIERPLPIAIVALSLNSAGFLAEIIANALRNVPRGEVEAGYAIGMSHWQVLYRIIAPNAARLSVRAYGNEVVFVVKGTAVVNFITITDLIGAANQIYFNTFDPITPLLVAGCFYLAIVFVLLGAVRLAERRLNPWLFATP